MSGQGAGAASGTALRCLCLYSGVRLFHAGLLAACEESTPAACEKSSPVRPKAALPQRSMHTYFKRDDLRTGSFLRGRREAFEELRVPASLEKAAAGKNSMRE